MSQCSVKREIGNLIPTITGFLANPSTFNTAAANQLVIDVELIQGAIRELPVSNLIKSPILDQLNLAITLLQNPSVGTAQLQTVIDILEGVVIELTHCGC